MDPNLRTGYAIYLRKSRKDDEAEARGEGETLARHERELTALARRNNLPVVAVYREIVSGESIANRPQMQRLLSAVSARQYTGVLCMEIERLARGDPFDQATVSNTFKFSQTLIITPYRTYQPDDSMDEEFVEFSLFMSRREYKTIVRRMQGGRRIAAGEGRYIASRAPYGYERIRRDTGEWTLAPIDDEAAIVRQIFAWSRSGIGNQRIATMLNRAGVPTKRSGVWHNATISHILHNPVYIGRVTWDKRKSTVVALDERGRKINKRISNPGHTDVQGLHPAIVDQEIFEAVQNKQKPELRPPVRSDMTLVNPLAGLVYCACCGAPLNGSCGSLKPNGKERYPYRLNCPRVDCENYGVALSILEDAILDTLNSWVLMYEGYKPAPVEDPNAEARETLMRQRKQLLQQRDRLCDLLERGVYDDETFSNRNAKLNAQLRNVESQLAELSAAPAPLDTEALIANLVPIIPGVIDAYRHADSAEAKNHLLRQVIDRVIYKKLKRCNNRENPADYVEITVYPFAVS